MQCHVAHQSGHAGAVIGPVALVGRGAPDLFDVEHEAVERDGLDNESCSQSCGYYRVSLQVMLTGCGRNVLERLAQQHSQERRLAGARQAQHEHVKHWARGWVFYTHPTVELRGAVTC